MTLSMSKTSQAFTPRAVRRIRDLSLWLVVGTVTVLTGCSWQIVPPETVEAEATVFVSLYGRHTKLALPAHGAGEYIEYGFGDWRYYAQAERSTASGVRALFSSDSSALSRREVTVRQRDNPEVEFHSQRSAPITVPEAEVAELRSELEATWSQSEGRSLRRGNTHFREIEQPYGLSRNSNQQTARWLEQLGCDIEGYPLWGNFSVERR